MAAFVDAEHALDLNYAKTGVSVEDLLVSQPDCRRTSPRHRRGACQIASSRLVIATRRGVDPKSRNRRRNGRLPRRPTSSTNESGPAQAGGACYRFGCTVVFINQLRMKIGVIFGNPETTTGGNALKFYSSVRIDIRRIGSIKSTSDITGNRIRAKVVKNKVAPPFLEAEFDLIFGEGINKTMELIDIGERHGVISKAGSWLSYNGEQLGQGRDQTEKRLRGDQELFSKIADAVRRALGNLEGANSQLRIETSEEFEVA